MIYLIFVDSKKKQSLFDFALHSAVVISEYNIWIILISHLLH
jgi:hypothetical protein